MRHHLTLCPLYQKQIVHSLPLGHGGLSGRAATSRRRRIETWRDVVPQASRSDPPRPMARPHERSEEDGPIAFIGSLTVGNLLYYPRSSSLCACGAALLVRGVPSISARPGSLASSSLRFSSFRLTRSGSAPVTKSKSSLWSNPCLLRLCPICGTLVYDIVLKNGHSFVKP